MHNNIVNTDTGRGINYRNPLSGTTIKVPPTNEVATKDAIRHFVDGIGDPNPLWRDEHYASTSKYGGIIAPPTFLHAIASVQSMPIERLPGFTRYAAGCDWEWFSTIKVNDTFAVTNSYDDLLVKRAEPIGRRLYLQSGRTTYINQRNETVGICQWSRIWSEKSQERKEFTPEELKRLRYKYSDDELKTIDKAYREEEIRGAAPRYWDEVVPGDVINPVVKGPLTHADMVAFVVGIGIMGQAHSLSPAWSGQLASWQDPVSGVKESGDGIHFLNEIARNMAGIPFPIDLGIQRLCWLAHMITNWMGDDGFIKGLSGKFRKTGYLGDTTWCRGKVIKKYIEDGTHLVECDVWCENQKHEINTTGKAIIILPTRS